MVKVIDGLRVALLAAMVSGPAVVQAEGSVFEVSCKANTICDSGGNCEASDMEIGFSVAPISQDGDLREFELVQDGQTFTARQEQATGPLRWQVGPFEHFLVPMGKSQALLVRQRSDGGLSADALFLTCDGLG